MIFVSQDLPNWYKQCNAHRLLDPQVRKPPVTKWQNVKKSKTPFGVFIVAGYTGEKKTMKKLQNVKKSWKPIWCFHCRSQERLLPLRPNSRRVLLQIRSHGHNSEHYRSPYWSSPSYWSSSSQCWPWSKYWSRPSDGHDQWSWCWSNMRWCLWWSLSGGALRVRPRRKWARSSRLFSARAGLHIRSLSFLDDNDANANADDDDDEDEDGEAVLCQGRTARQVFINSHHHPV